MNAIAESPSRTLALPESDLIQTLRDSLYPGAKDASIKMVIGWCRAAGKDPMKKPVHIVPMSVKKPGTRNDYEWRDVIMPGIVDYRTDAARTGQHAGNDEAVFGPEVVRDFDGVTVTYPEWCEFKVYRLVGGQRAPFSSGRVRWLETYATAGRDTTAPNAMWRKRPFGQLEKCAEAMALRRGFPEVGAVPTADEMVGRTIGDDADGVVIVDNGAAASASQAAAGPGQWPAEAFAAQLLRWGKAVEAKIKTADDILALARSKGALSQEQEAQIRALGAAAKPAASQPTQDGNEPAVGPPWEDDPPATAGGAK